MDLRSQNGNISLGSSFSRSHAVDHLCRHYRRRQWHPTAVLLPRKSHGQRSLVGCSPWVHSSRTRLSDFTFTFHFHALEKERATHSSVLAWRIPGTGEPGGLPSMGSQSWTRLKRLSSSSSSSNSKMKHIIGRWLYFLTDQKIPYIKRPKTKI